MLADPPAADKPVPRPLVFLGVTFAGLGVIAWAWTGVWQWGLTGLVLMLLCAAATGVRRGSAGT